MCVSKGAVMLCVPEAEAWRGGLEAAESASLKGRWWGRDCESVAVSPCPSSTASHLYLQNPTAMPASLSLSLALLVLVCIRFTQCVRGGWFATYLFQEILLPSEEEDVRLGRMHLVVFPSHALGDADVAPLLDAENAQYARLRRIKVGFG